MSNFYTEFSCQLDLGTPQKAHAALAFFDHLREHDNITTPIVYSFEMSLLENKGTSTLWIRDVGGYGDADEVVDFVLRLASETALAGLWGFEYSYTCSTPELGGFGGGAVVIDLNAATIVSKTTTDEVLKAALRGGCGTD